jgi:hypothetical protein
MDYNNAINAINDPNVFWFLFIDTLGRMIIINHVFTITCTHSNAS